jgi:hypothetical protein
MATIFILSSLIKYLIKTKEKNIRKMQEKHTKKKSMVVSLLKEKYKFDRIKQKSINK